MTFEQHPEVFWGLVTFISIVGGYAGSSLRSFISNLRHKNERITTN